jgi:hypothetical protein
MEFSSFFGKERQGSSTAQGMKMLDAKRQPVPGSVIFFGNN